MPIEPATAAALIAGGGFVGIADFLSDIAGAVPELAVARRDAAHAGRAEDLRRIDIMIAEFQRWAREFPVPVAIKTAVAIRGIKTGPLPVPLTPEKQRRLEEFRVWFTAWLPAAIKLYAHA